jgi:hypothetical protein
MTDDQKEIIQNWILTEIPEVDVVPGDEGSVDGLIYNLIHLLHEGRDFRHYHYEPDQDEELAKLLG